jgi:hypothetical protein
MLAAATGEPAWAPMAAPEAANSVAGAVGESISAICDCKHNLSQYILYSF